MKLGSKMGVKRSATQPSSPSPSRPKRHRAFVDWKRKPINNLLPQAKEAEQLGGWALVAAHGQGGTAARGDPRGG
jgi:hypothetical protein